VAFVGDSEFVFVNKKGQDVFIGMLTGRAILNSLGVKPKLVVFDLIEVDYKGRMLNLENYPIEQRKHVLEAVLPATVLSGNANYIELSHVYEDVEEFERIYEEIVDCGGEGAVFKKIGQPYTQYDGHDSSREWLKKKRLQTADCVVIGMKPGDKRRAETFGALVLGQYNSDGDLVEVGKVGTGFDDETLEYLSEFQLENGLPIGEKLTSTGIKAWLKAGLVVEVGYMERTRANKLFQPKFFGVRTDKSAKECTIEEEQ
jgi:bifunctional non-homologous end joining protein LigD